MLQNSAFPALARILSKDNGKVFGLIYGNSGTGKTELVGTLGELGEVLIIDIDKGYKTLKYSDRVKPYRDKLHVVSFDEFKDLDNALTELKKTSEK